MTVFKKILKGVLFILIIAGLSAVIIFSGETQSLEKHVVTKLKEEVDFNEPIIYSVEQYNHTSTERPPAKQYRIFLINVIDTRGNQYVYLVGIGADVRWKFFNIKHVSYFKYELLM